MKNHYKDWTRQEEERLARMLEAGISFNECAKALGRSKGAIYKRSRQIRIDPKPVEPVKNKSILDRILGWFEWILR